VSGRLAGKVALVTGAATGIGAAVAELYAEQGARVCLTDVRDGEGEAMAARIRDAGGQALFVHANAASGGDANHAAAAAEKAWGPLDIVTANAGILGKDAFRALHEIEMTSFDHVIAVNLYGVVHAFRAALPGMLERGGGVLTATTSLAAHRGVRGLDAYTASKAAIVGVVRSLTAQYGPRIRVNAVSPGAVRTELAAHTAELNHEAAARWPSRANVPIASARDIANAHLFLASPEAAFVCGQILVVDGGRSAVDVA
jgi:NAD(P)-dependent dehydrogenase (short-subunit alcohol dehydrogenase family)